MVPDTFNIYALVIVLAGWIFTLCFHEFSHALVAYAGGDKSVKKKGYLTFNPVRYMHPFLSLVLPVLRIIPIVNSMNYKVNKGEMHNQPKSVITVLSFQSIKG